MKHGKKLTKKQKMLLVSKDLNPEEWLVERDTTEVTVFINKYDNTRKFEVHKGGYSPWLSKFGYSTLVQQKKNLLT